MQVPEQDEKVRMDAGQGSDVEKKVALSTG